jgi:leucine-rich repeat protein SHOC2
MVDMNISMIIGIVCLLLFGAFSALYFNNTERTPLPTESVETSEEIKIEQRVDEESVATDEMSVIRDEVIDLHGQGLTKVPAYVFERSETEVLNLSENNLSGALPAEIRFLQNLVSLDLSDNNFTGVPAEIGQLSRLEILDLSSNPVTGLPYELGNLKHLKVLDLRNTEYSEQDLFNIKKGLSADVVIKL